MPRSLPALLLALAACGAADDPITAVDPPEGLPPPAEPVLAAPGPPLAAPRPPSAASTGANTERHAVFMRVGAIKDAVIAGDLAATHAPARALAEQSLAVPEPWKPHVAAMQSDARAVLAAKDLAAAGRATAELAGRCGACHQETETRLKLSFVPAPSHAPGAVSALQRHAWALDRLYQGVIAPSSAAWESGASVLAHAPLHVDELADDGESPPALRKLSTKVHALGVDAEAAGTPERMAQLYGELLGTCAACHARAR